MSENAEAVSATLTTNRNCTIEITNLSNTYCLTDPKVYMSSGFILHPPQPTVTSASVEVCTFIKDDHTATGAVGLLTYDLFHRSSRTLDARMALVFSVPYDRNLYKNRLTVGVVERSRACDKKLYEEMYEGKDEKNFSKVEGTGCIVEHKTQYVDMRATMSSIGRAIVKLELFDP